MIIVITLYKFIRMPVPASPCPAPPGPRFNYNQLFIIVSATLLQEVKMNSVSASNVRLRKLSFKLRQIKSRKKTKKVCFIISARIRNN